MKQLRKIRGSVLVVVLWITVILILVTATLAQSSHLNSRIGQGYGNQCACRWAARAAIETAIHTLSEDNNGYDGLDELWSDNPDGFEEIELEGCTVTVKVKDESGKLNINTADKKHLVHLLEMTDEQADSIIDWRDKDENIGDEGAEAGYYNTLEYPYSIRNAPFKTTREVLFVKGVEGADFYGTEANPKKQIQPKKGLEPFLTCWSFCRNVDAQGQARVNIKRTDEGQLQQKLELSAPHAKWIKEKAGNLKSIADLIDNNTEKQKSSSDGQGDQPKPIDLETFKGIADMITVLDEDILPGRVNINTAGREVLTALLAGDEKLAEEILQYRDELVTPMTSIAELLNMKTMTIDTFKGIAPTITVRSDVFSMKATAVADATGFKYTVRVVVIRDATSCEIIYWYEGIGN
jgi:type II secretory pathway component PulK